MLKRLKSGFLVSALVFIGISSTASQAIAQAARQLVTQVVNERQTVELTGNIRPEANAANDRGRVDDSLVLEHVQLLLKRPAEREAALETLINQLHDPKSANFHQWLTAEQFNAQFGPSDADRNLVSDWLSKHGLTVNNAQSTSMVIDFSGTAGQIRDTFNAGIHQLDVGGVSHIANMKNPQIPAALADVIGGVVSLNNFRPHTNYKPKPEYTYVSGTTAVHAVVPADLATIYNLNPVFKTGVTGRGQTIVVIEDTNVYSTADWAKFRSTFGLSGYTTGSFSQVHPAPAKGANNCLNPGVTGDESEAELDAEWASAAAPGAAVVLASCQNTNTTFGGLIALQNLVNSRNPPAIVSMSYGECEAFNGAAANAAYRAIYQQAVAMGTSVFVSSGDEGAASCDADQPTAYHGIGVSGFASTPYNVAVGGTDFGDTAAKTSAIYWSSANTPAYGSALSYIPEIPWNDSCASSLLATANGFKTTYGASGFCNSTVGKSIYFLTTASGSGGPSGCATGNPANGGIVGGTCRGAAKPAWQASLVGNPADGVRDIPDVSLFAANGAWGHYYVYCDSNVANGGAACTGAPSGWSGAGGTSFASPIWAAFQALINQKTGARQGNPNPVYYALAAAEFGAGGTSTCNSSLGKGGAAGCIFHNISSGDMDVVCAGKYNCYLPSGSYGVLSLSNSSYSKAYNAAPGWNFATGIGSVDVDNLVNAWPR